MQKKKMCVTTIYNFSSMNHTLKKNVVLPFATDPKILKTMVDLKKVFLEKNKN